MAKLLDRTVKPARSLSPTVQDEIAGLPLQHACNDVSLVILTDEERAAIAVSKAAAARGEFASDDQVRAVWEKHISSNWPGDPRPTAHV